MNHSIFSEFGVLEARVTSRHFCQTRLSPERQKKSLTKCLDFFAALPEGKWSECPFGFSALRCGFHCVCGCFSSAVPFRHSVRTRQKIIGPEDSELLTKDDSKTFIDILKAEIYCESYSGFVHDFSHSIGFLKTHLDSCRRFRIEGSHLNQIYILYDKLVAKFEEYNSSVITRPNLDELINSKLILSKIYDSYQRKIDHYRSLIDSLPSLFAEIERMVALAKDEINNLSIGELDRHRLHSLLNMNGLFECRLEYANKIYAFNKSPSENRSFSTSKSSYSIYNMIQKLVYLLKTPAEQKQLRGLFLNGNSYLNPRTTKDVYLGFFILLENALKYAKKNTEVIVEVRDYEDRCDVRILNHSDYISNTSMKQITKAGFTGENGRNKESHGLGLAIAQRIFSEPETSLSFTFDQSSLCFEAKVSIYLNNNSEAWGNVDSL